MPCCVFDSPIEVAMGFRVCLYSHHKDSATIATVIQPPGPLRCKARATTGASEVRMYRTELRGYAWAWQAAGTDNGPARMARARLALKSSISRKRCPIGVLTALSCGRTFNDSAVMYSFEGGFTNEPKDTAECA